VRDHDGWCDLGVKIAEELEDDLLIGGVQVAGGLIGEDDFRIIDQGAGDGDALLFAAGELRGQVSGAGFHADAAQGGHGLLLIGHAVEELGEHDVFESGEMRDQMELLEDETDGFARKRASSERLSLVVSVPWMRTMPVVA